MRTPASSMCSIESADQHIALGISDDIDIDLDGVVEKAVEQHRRIVRHAYGFGDVAFQIGVAMHDFHRSSANHIAL